MKLPPEMTETDSGKHIRIRVHARWAPAWWPFGWQTDAIRVWLVPFFFQGLRAIVCEWWAR